MIGNAVVDNAYFSWLMDKIECYDDEYIQIMEILDDIPFRWTVDHDDNRAEDGKCLRELFMYEEDWHTCPKEDQECSVLEMLVALAERIEEDIMWDPNEFDRSADWFWMMINNLGITDRTENVEEIINNFLDRKYDKSGNGGLFPCHFLNGKNQKKMEIWHQMQEYMMENYEF